MSQRFDSIEFYHELENRRPARVREFEAHRFRQWWRVWFQRAPACARQRTDKPGLAGPAFGERPASARRPAFKFTAEVNQNNDLAQIVSATPSIAAETVARCGSVQEAAGGDDLRALSVRACLRRCTCVFGTEICIISS